MKMCKILDCDAKNCIYNKNKKCHTMAINIGDTEPICDTFMSSPSKGGFDDVIGGVGSCKVGSCSFNKSFECAAQGVHMSVIDNHVNCKTYHKK